MFVCVSVESLANVVSLKNADIYIYILFCSLFVSFFCNQFARRLIEDDGLDSCEVPFNIPRAISYSNGQILSHSASKLSVVT